jgi:type VII secretion protein EccB
VASRRDQLQSYQFLTERVISALVIQQSDPEQPPFRRAKSTAFGSLALALVALAGFGVFGLISPSGSRPSLSSSQVIVEKETGTRFVFVNGRLNPVTNYTSALLIIGQHAGTKSISRKSLVGVPRGPLVGIADAPDELPDRKHLLGAPWTMCSQPAINDAGTRVDQSVLLVGQEPPGGAVGSNRAVLLDVPTTGKEYLLWRGYRHEIVDRRTVSLGLALADESRVQAGTAWLNALPAGRTVGPIPVAGAGSRSTAVPSRPETRAGALFVLRAAAGPPQFYLAQADRLMPISQFQYDIQIAAPQTQLAYPGVSPHPIALDPAEVTLVGERTVTSGDYELPLVRPTFVQTRSQNATICAAFAGVSVPRLAVEPILPPQAGLPTGGRSPTGTPLADRIVVRPGWAALVTVVTSAQAPAGTLSLVTDLGRRYALASRDVMAMLGYDGVTAIRIPAGLAARIPEGPALDPAAAKQQPAR